MRYVVTPPSPAWPSEFIAEAKRLQDALGTSAIDLHHVGSTAINGIFAKPIIDILLVTTDLELLDHAAPEMVSLGYEVMGEFGIPGRRYFRKDSAEGLRTHQIHAFQFGSPHIERHLAFRDHMNAHADAATAYSEGRSAQMSADHGWVH